MKKLNGITDVFFDLDHTLWDFEKNSALTFEKIFKINNISIDLEAFLEIYKPINFKYWKLYRTGQIEHDVLRFQRLNETFNILGVFLQEYVIHRLYMDYIEYLITFDHLIEGAISILEYLSTTYNLHIITNGFRTVQHEKMKKSKITHYFKTITYPEDVGVKKPDSKIFNYALQLANVKASKTVMVGDSLEADIEGAKAMGMTAIHLKSECYEHAKNALTISKLSQLKHYL